MPSPLARNGVTVEVIAGATGASEDLVRAWLTRRDAPTGVQGQRLSELSAIVDRLAHVIRADYIPTWLSNPIDALNEQTPVALIARGEHRRVARVVSELEDPGAV